MPPDFDLSLIKRGATDPLANHVVSRQCFGFRQNRYIL